MSSDVFGSKCEGSGERELSIKPKLNDLQQ